MASLGVGLLLASARSHPQLTLGFSAKPQIPSIATLKFSPTPSFPSPSTFRCICSRKLQINQKLLIVSATNPNSGSGKSDSDEKESSSSSQQGPPFLTILAGFFLLFLIGWVIVSILTWLIGLIVNVLPPK